MKTLYLAAILGVIAIAITGCATSIDRAEHLNAMLERQDAPYCSIDKEGGEIVINNRKALEAYYRLGSMPSCEVLYNLHYNHGAPTVAQKQAALEFELKSLKKEIEHLKNSDEVIK